MNTNVLYTYIICILISSPIKGQSKYFKKSVGWGDSHSGYKIKQSNNDYFVIGTFITDAIRQVYSLTLNQYGDTSALNIYEQETGGNIVHFDTTPRFSGYALTGWMSPTIANESADAFLLFINQEGEEVELFNIGNEDYNTAARAILSTTDNSFLIGGYSIPNTTTNDWELWLTKVDSEGNKIWEHTYEEYPKSNYISELLPHPDGGYYAVGTINASNTTGHIIILQIDESGEIIEDTTYTFGGSDGAGAAILTNDGGLFIDGFTNADDWMQLKLDSDLNIEWQYDEYSSGCSGTVQLPDSSYVITGCYDHSDELKLQLNLTKISADGSTTLWNRFYGGPGNDYGYDMTTTPDGGFIISGRTETPGHADVYIVKTNCMGLLTEPQAAFDYTTTELTTQFTNTSQYVYPDSIDGGHYSWNFGDGTVSSEVSPSHTYQAGGYYTVTLTAVVCSDTSVVSEVVAVGAVGIHDAVTTFSVSPFYPNPATQTATMTYDLGAEQAVLQVFDVTGRLLKSVDLKGQGSFEMDLTDWVAGVYFYQVTTDTSVAHDFNRGRHNSWAILREKLVVLGK